MKIISRTIREQVTDQIRDQVIKGTLQPGQALRETEFAKKFGVSRGPVRDAFLQLAQEGLLAYEANRGVTVNTPPDPKNRTFITSLRQQIECYVIKTGLKNLTEAGLTKIEEALADLQAACSSGSTSRVAQADLAFHETVLLECGGSEFLATWKGLCSQMLMTYARLDNYDDVYAEHLAIVEALKQKKTALAQKAIKENIQ